MERPGGGPVRLVTVPGAGDLTAAIESAAREREVLVAPGAFFGAPAGFRLAWAAPAEHLDEGLARLTEVIRAIRK